MIAEIRCYNTESVQVNIYTNDESIEPFFTFETRISMDAGIFTVLEAHGVKRVELLDDNLPITYTTLAMYFTRSIIRS